MKPDCATVQAKLFRKVCGLILIGGLQVLLAWCHNSDPGAILPNFARLLTRNSSPGLTNVPAI